MDPQQVGVLLEDQCREKSLLTLWSKCGGALALLMDLKAVYCPITTDHKHFLGGSYPCNLQHNLFGTGHVTQHNPFAA